jgi:hypothetical protein
MLTDERVAHLTLSKVGDRQLLRVSLPSKVTEAEYAVVQDSVTAKISQLTGHQGCRSGTIDILMEERFDPVITVDLARA